MACIYTQMDAAGIPEPIIDGIARQVHTDRFQEGVKETLDTLPPLFERTLKKTKDFTHFLNMHAKCYYVDGNYDYISVVLKTTWDTFVVYHYYRDCSYYDYILMEIDTNIANHPHLIRFYCTIKDERFFHNLESYQADQSFNPIPFQYLADITGLDESLFEDYLEDHIETNWRDPASLVNWFHKNERQFEDFGDRYFVTKPIYMPLVPDV